MKKILAALLATVMVLGVMVVPSFAAEVPAGEYGVNYVKYGDVDYNNTISAADALLVLQNVVGKTIFDATKLLVADTDVNQKADAADALAILKYVVGKVSAFEAGMYCVLKEMEIPANPDQEAADEVIAMIDAVAPPVTLDVKDAIVAIRAAYDALTDVQKALVTNYDKLVGFENDIAALEKPVTGNYIMDYDKSNSVNGAYEKDPTADTSFVIDISTLSPNTMYRMNAGTTTPTTVGGASDCSRLIYSLQGLINRDFGMDADHTSMLIAVTETADSGWLTQMTGEGSILQYAKTTTGLPGMSEVRVNTWDAFLETFLPVIKSCGIILWDGNVPATANVAATICGLDGYLPVLANSPLHTILVEQGVPVKQSLVGLFKNGQYGQKIADSNAISTGSAKNDAYLWALEKYFPRCSSKYLAYTLDGAITLKGYEAYPDHPTAVLGGDACLKNHDYLIARRCFFFDLAPYKGEAACDDPAQQNGQAGWGVDNATMLKIFQARYDRANGAFGALMGFPPWWAKYCTHHNQGSKADVWIEWLYCEYITCYNLAKEADAAHPASMTNGSVMYKYIPMVEKYENNVPSEKLTYNSNTYYYTIYVGDYDSSAWLKQHIYAMWAQRGGDKKRGPLPLMWSINPNLSDRVPVIFDYMYKNKTDLDFFAGGDGGAGYIIPSALFHDQTLAYAGEKRPAGNAEAGDIFANYSKPYYDRFDMDITGFLINAGNGNITSKMAATVAKYSPIGGFFNDNKAGVYKSGNSRFVGCLTGITKGNTSSSSSEMYNFANNARNKGLNFGAYRTVCWTPTEINAAVSAFQSYATSKGMNAQYCDPYTYFDLIQQSGQGSNI
ncbi:MAG: hypothetical protein IKU10_05720 [Clostridia bacterium]|nr:hypothetical protein [Clostridia bacterium]